MKKILSILGLAVVLVYLISDSLVAVDDSEILLITRFGEPKRQIDQGGLSLKWPSPVETALRFDKRVHALDADEVEFLTRDNKSVLAAGFLLWRIADAQKFLESVKNRSAAERRLIDLVNSEMGVAFGQNRLSAFFSPDGQGSRLPEVLAGVTGASREQAAENFGIELIDIRLRRLGFPEQTIRSIYNRMLVEREKIAKQYRAEGEEKAAGIRAQTDKEVREILAKAYQEAQVTKGEAEAEAARIYAEAYGRDPEFYKLVSTLDAYKQFLDADTTLILSADSPLFRYLEAPPEGLQ